MLCVCSVHLGDMTSTIFVMLNLRVSCLSVYSATRSGELQTHKLKSHLLRAQSLMVLPLKSGVGQYIAVHATLTTRDFFLAYFYP